MKKISILLLLLVCVLSLSGCDSGTTKIEKSESADNNSSGNEIIAVEKKEAEEPEKIEKTEEKKFDSDLVASQLSVTEYNLFGDYWNYHFIEITNNSEEVTKVSLNILYYDENGELVSAESCSEDVVEPGFSVLLYTMPDEKWSKTEITVEASESRYYAPIQSDIEISVTPAKQKLVVQAKNVGDEPAEFVQVSALFFDGEDVVGFGNHYFSDSDYEIKPEKTISGNIDCYKDFDGYKYYVTGRRKK